MRALKSTTIFTLALLAGCAPQHIEPPQAEGDGASRKGGHADLVEDLREQLSIAGVTELPAPPAVSDEMFVLGQALSFDRILSGNQNIACLTCHHPNLGTGDDRALSLGEGGEGLGQDRVGGEIIPRNAPELWNRHALEVMFWDGRVTEDYTGFTTPAGGALTAEMQATFDFGALSAQAMFPVTSREEMRGHSGTNELADLDNSDFSGIWSGLMARLGAIPEYVDLFEAAYPGTDFDDMTFAHAANAIGGFEAAGFAALNSPFSQFVAGDDDALSDREIEDALVFFDSGCAECHSGPMLSDQQFHNTGLAQFGPGKGDGPHGTDDFGRFRETGDPLDLYAFRTPSLHNVELNGPWGHDGQFNDLEAFVAHYVEPEESLLAYDITDNVAEGESELYAMVEDNVDDVLANLEAMDNPDDDNDVRAIVRFLETLTDPDSLNSPELVPDSVPSGLLVDTVD